MEEVKLAVIGDPVDHSISPEMHNYWFKMHSIKYATYERIRVPKVYLLSFLKSMAESGYLGVNITLPLKEEAYHILKELGTVCPLSERAKAVNTVVVRDGVLHGYNTDISGFYDSLVKNIPSNYDLTDKVILVIGAGGAARGVVAAFAINGLKKIVVANRTIKRAEKLRDELLPGAKVLPLDRIDDVISQVDVIINTISIGIISGKKLDIDLKKSNKTLVCYDIIYKPYFTDFLEQAKNEGHIVVHGMSMLMEQGALSFNEWFGEEPDVTHDLTDYLLNL